MPENPHVVKGRVGAFHRAIRTKGGFEVSKQTNKRIEWAVRFLFFLVPVLVVTPYAETTAAPAYGHIATPGEARVVAESWLGFIVERDGHWGGAQRPSIGEFTEFRRGDLLLGYYASVKPQGYIVISSLKDFAPIKAYSTTSNLDPAKEVGMCALLKGVLEIRMKFLINRFGGLEEASLQGLDELTPDANRLAWSYLLEGGSALRKNLRSIYPQGAGPVPGPDGLLKTSWNQVPPYNDLCPSMGCDWSGYGNFNDRAWVGCVPLAMAQIMKYYCWPPSYLGNSFDWRNMLNRYVWNNATQWFDDEHGNAVTGSQINAVAFLCECAGHSHYDWTAGCGIDYGCDSTSAQTCSYWCNDSRDAYEDYFLYDTEDFEPQCQDRDDWSYDGWWNLIKGEIDLNRPLQYRISDDDDYAHGIVVDGYDDSGGQRKVHANYGHDAGDTSWYALDHLYCGGDPCDLEEEYCIRHIFPRNGLCGTYYGTLTAASLPHYVYCDVNVHNDVEGGALVQFLPGTSMKAGYGFNISGRAGTGTRFFSGGLLPSGLPPSEGLKVSAGGQIKIHYEGGIRVH